MLLDEAYRILEVPPTASDEEIKAAHRDLSKVWHPDRFANDASVRRRAEEKLINPAIASTASPQVSKISSRTPLPRALIASGRSSGNRKRT